MSARRQYSALVEVDLDELARLAADAEIGLSVYRYREPCTCDSARGCPACFADAEALIDFTVRHRRTGEVFVVTATDAEDGFPSVVGGRCWARLEAVTVLAPPDGEDPR
jgi:hypothetical protein